MTLKCVWIFPVLTFSIIALSFVITYFVAVYNEHVVPVFPYISDTGTIPPESCIYAQLLNIGALFGCVTVYLRHRQIVEYYRYSGITKKWLIVTSLLFLWIGYFSCLGISLSANFQETSVIQVHMVGAFMAFGLGLLYGYGQTFLTYLLDRQAFVGRWMGHLRLLICALATVFFVLLQVYGFASNGGKGSPFLDYDWSTTTGRWSTFGFVWSTTTHPSIAEAITFFIQAYKETLVSAISEWAFALCLLLYFLTFAAEFSKSILLPSRMVMKNSLQNIQQEQLFERTDDPELGTGTATTNGTDINKWRQTAFPEIRVPPPLYDSRQQKYYHSTDEIFDRRQPNYGTNTTITQPPPTRTWHN